MVAQLQRTLLIRLPLVVFALFTLFPIYWLARSSFMTEGDLLRVPLQYLPLPFTLVSYQEAFRQMSMARVMVNSLIVAGGTCICSLALMLLVPLFVMLRIAGLLDTLAGVIVAELLGAIPFSALLLKQFFDQITPELDDAAMIDGCGRIQALAFVIVPLVLPGIVAVTIFNFINVWNALILPTILLIDPSNFTLPVALMLLRDRNTSVCGMQAAGGMLNLLPSLLLFALIQRYLISGLTSGAVKG